MKNLLWAIPLALGLMISCSPEGGSGAEGSNPELDSLKAENERLRSEVDNKDEEMNETIRLLNEIEDNLTLIREKENVINLNKKNDAEIKEDQKDRIIEEIQIINSLMEENRNKINSLRGKLKKADVKIGELEKMVENLLAKISDQEATITSLREELARYDIAMDELTATLNETMAVVEEKEAELNTAFYVIGSSKELKEEGIITKEGGFIGLGKIKKLREDFNKDYFTQIDITKHKEIILGGKTVEILTTHPSGTYKLEGDKVKEKLVIADPEKFWSVSKYLVIVLE